MRFAILATALLFLQDPTNGPIRAKQALSAARTAAAEVDGSYEFFGFATQPSSDKVYDTGRAEGWTFQFYTKKKCAPGKKRYIGVQIWPDTKAYPAKRNINGMGVNMVQDTEMEPPFHARADEDWMDSDRAFKAFKKAGWEKAGNAKVLEVRWIGGHSLWHGIGNDDNHLWLDSSGKIIAKGAEVDRTLLETYARPVPIAEIEAVVRREASGWKDAGDIKVVSLDGTALDATEFVKDPKLHWASVEFYFQKTVLKRFGVRVVNERVEWNRPCIESEPKKEEVAKIPAWTFKNFDTKKLSEALANSDKVKEWLAKSPKATVRVMTFEETKLLITFGDDDKKIVRWDIEKQTLE